MFVLCVSFAVALLDQVTKELVRERIACGNHVTLIPNHFDLTYVQNTGAAWGMFQGLNQWLVLLSVLMLLVIVIFHRHFLTNTLICKLAVGLMIGGIAGNLMDRLRWDYVVDFLDFFWGARHFPAFNAADSSICIGVGLYMISQFTANKADGKPGCAEKSTQSDKCKGETSA